MKALIQDHRAEPLFEIEVVGTAPDIVISHTPEGTVYYKCIFLKENGNAIYRPATHHHRFPSK